MPADYSDFEDLIIEVDDDGVATFQIHRPEKLNAMRGPTFWEIMDAGRRLQADPDVRVVESTMAKPGLSRFTRPDDRPRIPQLPPNAITRREANVGTEQERR